MFIGNISSACSCNSCRSKAQVRIVVTLNVYYFLTNNSTRFGDATRFRSLVSLVDLLLRMRS